MEELLTLKDLLLKGDVPAALAIVEELEEMSRDDKISTIGSYAIILLLHLIKQQVENRSTRCLEKLGGRWGNPISKNPPTFRSWQVSIRNFYRAIQKKNKRRQAGGYYLTPEELRIALEEAYPDAIDRATLEVEEGRYQPAQLEQLVNREEILNQAMVLILPQE